MLSDDEELPSRTKLIIMEIKKLIDLCLSNCYFLWENNIHQLDNSGPIGLALMVVISEAFLQHHEANALATALNRNINIKSFVRYVDDSHSRVNTIEHANQFLEILNQQNDHLKYTMEIENKNKSLNFLDITITNTKKGSYSYNVYRKPAITNVQVKPHSGHDPKILKGIFIGFINRAHKICSEQHLNDEIEFLVQTFKENGYEENTLRTIFSQYKKKDVSQQT